MKDLIFHVVAKISGYEEKTGRSGQVGDVQHVHMYVGNVYRKLRGDLSLIVTPFPPWPIKGGRGLL